MSRIVVVLSCVALWVLVSATLASGEQEQRDPSDANVVAPANGFANLWPARIDFARGGLLTGLVGIAIMPWRLLENADRYIGWLMTYSGFLGPIAGIFVADYWVVRRARLALADLYAADGSFVSDFDAKTSPTGAYSLGPLPAGQYLLKADPGAASSLVVLLLLQLLDYGAGDRHFLHAVSGASRPAARRAYGVPAV